MGLLINANAKLIPILDPVVYLSSCCLERDVGDDVAVGGVNDGSVDDGLVEDMATEDRPVNDGSVDNATVEDAVIYNAVVCRQWSGGKCGREGCSCG